MPHKQPKQLKQLKQPKQPKQPTRCDLKLSVTLIVFMPHKQPKQPGQPTRCDLKLSVALIVSMPHKQPKQSRQPKQPERGDKTMVSRTDSCYATQEAQSPGNPSLVT